MSLTPDEHATSDVAEICRRLDGIPLAIELAAALVPVLSFAQIATRLDDRLRLLVRGARTAPPRHQMLRATIDWSYELLVPDEQLFFDQLAVFSGGCSLEAAEAVCRGNGIGPRTLLQLLARLVDKSLIVAEPVADGNVRYRLLESLRDYGREHLVERGEAGNVHARHAAFFLDLAERAQPELEGPRRKAMLDQLELEHDNLRAALRWFIDWSESESAQRFGAALGLFWFFKGHLYEGRAWLAELLALAPDSSRSETRAKLLYATGLLAQFQGDHTAAHAALEESLAIWRELGRPRQIARTLQLLGQLAWMRSELDAARTFLEEGLALARQARDRFLEALILRGLADVALDGGELTSARMLAEEALTIGRPVRANTTLCQALRILGEVSHKQGDLRAARSFLEASLEIGREFGEGFWVASVLLRLGRVALDEGEAQQAGALFAESLALFQALGDRPNMDRARDGLARVAEVQPNSGMAQHSPAPGALTPREREVALLVAAGLSNREVAAQLVIAEKTAANHVARILDKLDLHSRAQLAARATHLGLATLSDVG